MVMKWMIIGSEVIVKIYFGVCYVFMVVFGFKVVEEVWEVIVEFMWEKMKGIQIELCNMIVFNKVCFGFGSWVFFGMLFLFLWLIVVIV